MPVQVSWLNETRTILCMAYRGVWDLNEFYQSSNEARRLLVQVTHSVDVIIDTSETNHLPNGFLSALRSVIQRRPANTRLVVVVGGNPLIRGLIQVMHQLPMVDLKMFTADNVDDAVAMIDQRTSEVG